jgi:hypothetical protein
MKQKFYELRERSISYLPEEQRSTALYELTRERFQSEVDDADWARWYNHYHVVVRRPADRDVVLHVQRGLGFNLEAAALYTLVSAGFVPALRHWWCILPACLWTFSLINGEFWDFRRAMDKWSTLSAQITYLILRSLIAQLRLGRGEAGRRGSGRMRVKVGETPAPDGLIGAVARARVGASMLAIDCAPSLAL